jgi:succinoglycan biosynthesis protein ExoM
MSDTAISVVVACFDRLDLLERTLRAVLLQALPDGLTWELVVADNHPDLLARSLVEGLAASAAVPVRHIQALPARNLAGARNAGVAAARGAFIAFVDDDEAPGAGWLAAHHACLLRTGADASFGPKYPMFEGGVAPSWDPRGWFYTVDLGMAQDEEVRPLDWWPPRGRGLGTGNSMLRVATCLAGPKPFDEIYGRTGGEDTRLLLPLSKAGRRFVWCADAPVVEFNRLERLTKEYMRKRLRRSGQHSAECRLAVSDNKAVTKAGFLAIGLAQVVVHGALWAANRFGTEPRRAKHWLGIAKGMGKLSNGRALDFVPEPRSASH